MAINCEPGDSLHTDHAWDHDSEQVVATVGPDWDELDRRIFGNEPEEHVVTFSDMCAALNLIVGWACSSPDLKHVGGRIAAIGVLLDPVNAMHGRTTLSDVAREVGVTRAAVSKWVLDFRHQFQTSITVGKKDSARATYRSAQLKAFAEKRHSAFKRRDSSQNGHGTTPGAS